MVIVGVPYSVPGMIHTEARVGRPTAAAKIAGHCGELHPTTDDFAIARSSGKRVAETTVISRGKNRLSAPVTDAFHPSDDGFLGGC
jgi:NAD(P)H dehydrogenase (quinone)